MVSSSSPLPVPGNDEQRVRCSVVPEYNINFFSTITYSFVNKLISYGASTTSSSDHNINIEDIPHPPFHQSSEVTGDKFEIQWQKEKLKNPTAPNIVKALFWSHGHNFCFSFITLCGFIALSALQPFFITLLLEYVSTQEVDFYGMKSGLGIAVTLGMISFVNAFVLNAAMYFMYCFGMSVKSSLIARIFHKSLLISNSVKENRSVGEIVTLMSVDVERIYYGAMMFPWLLLSPTMIFVATVLLVVKMSYSALLVCVFIVLLGWSLEDVSKRVGRIRGELVQHTVERTLLVNETLNGIRVVKMYAWEKVIQEKIDKVRQKEVVLLRKYLVLKIVSTVSRVKPSRCHILHPAVLFCA